jgi:hypothetical protein
MLKSYNKAKDKRTPRQKATPTSTTWPSPLRPENLMTTTIPIDGKAKATKSVTHTNTRQTVT